MTVSAAARGIPGLGTYCNACSVRSVHHKQVWGTDLQQGLLSQQVMSPWQALSFDTCLLQEFLPMAGLNLNDTLRLASIW